MGQDEVVLKFACGTSGDAQEPLKLTVATFSATFSNICSNRCSRSPYLTRETIELTLRKLSCDLVGDNVRLWAFCHTTRSLKFFILRSFPG